MHAAVVGIALKGMRLKRAMDVAGAAVMLALLLPLLGGIAFAIKVGSPGPVFFVQRRTGRGGKPFFLLKFRTFRAEVMEPRPHPWRDGLLDLADDPRLTPMGSFLRRTSLDELPVLVNVLRGDMSLVGPTALPAASNSSDEPPEAAGRYAVRPGMTGPSQIMSYTDPPQDAARRDLDYASGRSFIGDIKLLFRTVGAVLTRRPPRS
jgi:lipopolysaccharide/colanic/teichoic acid biosynthesis glycosyltransferase